MAITPSKLDYQQVIRSAFSEDGGDLAAGSWLLQKAGRAINVTYPNGTTEVYTFVESDSTTVRAVTVVYTDTTKASISSATRST